ncbi:L-glutamine:scyllo-inosose aminotransferase [Streptoalloteichus tenebrarius]|uniref:Putative L-glutamine:3-amino-2,3-dideoxy-scyllo-inosose aminotransferase n=2 Tax=Streptoalloteichus tenebrarius (strain ATCC 17920 / DSM 40477 / JCM 4838 / CBS 697.72 / NBRC 16177 / NCIMB 11028 / NRRL B-12390 / A12253. 1 / ISP 5477) TaxID=1933 RepID=GLADA_STRSD|nr:DegT/DnrJ/EryC1/StrS family aminotransferase [Streptoalloteichus tenebrarius]Q2MF12.1 RecName: Full=Putative L-glutamine:3-amino-2,3-dideoxy-scyllo-inosose aminotransferase; Short=Putative L-glutamine:amino-DOI aminotransferase [Streptoalloteichus tenebrarius]MCP2261259.1 L-glutamine:scyllo-inosose aminotransferase [Streptoalloteichus tenebrarius]BFF04452.1 DegT/DnrJ/EryC1/StrS family aminotransferase [Streptoalloteichus tenebrarius]CAH18560.1 putative L-glutamine:hexose-3''-aminotransferase
MTSELALFGGTPVRTEPFPDGPRFRERDLERIREVLESGSLGGIPFPNRTHRAFAEQFCGRLGARHGVLVANGTVSLSVALRALGVHAGDEVITTGYTWMGTAASIVHINAVPVLVDIDPNTWCIDPAAVEAAITPRTRAIVPVHLANQIADLDALLEIARKHDLVVLEDCAHAHFAEWRGRCVGTHGDAGSFSFESSKIMTSGEGGFLVSGDETTHHRAMSLVNCGRKEEGYDSFEGRMLGWNNRATELQAAFLIGQVEQHDELHAQRKSNVELLTKGLTEIGGFTPVGDDDPRVTRRQYYEVLYRFDPEQWAGVHRDRVLEALLAEGVEFEGITFYPPLHRDSLFTVSAEDWPMIRDRYGDRMGPEDFHLPVSERAAYDESVWVHHSLLTGPATDVDQILEAVAKVRRNVDALR